MAYGIFIEIDIIFRNLRGIEEVEEALAVFCLGDGLGVLRSLLGFLLQYLLSQALPGMPFNLCPEEVSMKSITHQS